MHRPRSAAPPQSKAPNGDTEPRSTSTQAPVRRWYTTAAKVLLIGAGADEQVTGHCARPSLTFRGGTCCCRGSCRKTSDSVTHRDFNSVTHIGSVVIGAPLLCRAQRPAVSSSSSQAQTVSLPRHLIFHAESKPQRYEKYEAGVRPRCRLGACARGVKLQTVGPGTLRCGITTLVPLKATSVGLCSGLPITTVFPGAPFPKPCLLPAGPPYGRQTGCRCLPWLPTCANLPPIMFWEQSCERSAVGSTTTLLACPPPPPLRLQMAGYSRHRTVYRLRGYAAMRAELRLDVSRLWQRNLVRISVGLRRMYYGHSQKRHILGQCARCESPRGGSVALLERIEKLLGGCRSPQTPSGGTGRLALCAASPAQQRLFLGAQDAQDLVVTP